MKFKNFYNIKGNAPMGKIVSIVIGIIVFVAVVLFIFRVDINSYIRNLPGYSVPENDTEIDISKLSDEEIKDLCPIMIGKINIPEEGVLGIGNKQYIFINNEKTNLYWSGEKREGAIKISKGDFKVADVKKGIVSLNSGFFNSNSEFDLDSEDYQKIRFSLGIDISDFVKINNSFYAGNNLLCKISEDDIKIDYGFPEVPIILTTELLDLEKVSRGLFWMDKGLKINFSPYITLPEKSHFEFLYIQNRGEYFEIKGASFPIDWVELGRIYSDGSVWLDRDRLTKEQPGSGAIITSEVSERFRGIYEPYYESNLKVNYEEIKKLFK